MECFLIINYYTRSHKFVVVLYMGYCNSMVIDENQLSSAQNILSTTKLNTQNNKSNLHTTIDLNGYC